MEGKRSNGTNLRRFPVLCREHWFIELSLVITEAFWEEVVLVLSTMTLIPLLGDLHPRSQLHRLGLCARFLLDILCLEDLEGQFLKHFLHSISILGRCFHIRSPQTFSKCSSFCFCDASTVCQVGFIADNQDTHRVICEFLDVHHPSAQVGKRRTICHIEHKSYSIGSSEVTMSY